MSTNEDALNNYGDGNQDRWEELQIDRLLFGLSPDEQAEYEALARRMSAGETDFERVVASIDVAWADADSMPLPDHLRKTIRDRALQELASPRPVVAQRNADAPRARFARLPWAVAAVCLGLAIYALAAPQLARLLAPDIVQLRAELVSSSPDLIERSWSAGPTPIAGAEGDVVWSPSRQQGYMRFRGLPVNDPTMQQYQLWIFDRNQDEKTPVDGGVFDVSASGEVVVPIQAKLKVAEAYLFAVTIEKPGGVVVSSRERLPLLAMVQK